MPKEFDPDEFKLDVHSIRRRGIPRSKLLSSPVFSRPRNSH